MWRSAWVSGSTAILLLGCRGEPKVLEPRTPPSRGAVAVQMPPAPIAPGMGRVVLASTDAPLKVTARADFSFVPPGAGMQPTRTGELCTTPCVVDLPQGTYKLYMVGAETESNFGDTDTLQVRDGVNYWLRAPGKYEPPTWIPVVPSLLVALGVSAVLTGAYVASKDDDTSKAAGLGLAGAGVGISIVGGIMVYDAGRGARQDGATTTWTEPLR